jgi:ABC-2 type transport system permease protein
MSTSNVAWHSSRNWRTTRLGVLNERAFRVRLLISPAMLGVQLFLYDRLWTAVYIHVTSSAGLGMEQTISYSLIALLVVRIQWSSRIYSRDRLSVRVRDGTVIYWFLRPLPPGHYYMWRQLGDMIYGFAWAAAGYIIIRSTGVIEAPGNITHTAVFAISLLLGQIVFYYLGQVVELSTFWFVGNDGTTRLYYFVQDLLSGVFVPLWFMPDWLRVASVWLPFNAGINVPVSIYIDRIPMSQVVENLGLQALWVALLAATTWRMWSRASRRVIAQGG